MSEPVTVSRGFSLVEVLVATAITAAIAALACGIAVEAQSAWRADNARVDVQQRARVASDVLTRALLDAGGGPHTGPSRGSLVRVMAPVLPRRTGARRADAPEAFHTDIFTVFNAVPEAEHAVLLAPAVAGTAVIEIAPSPICHLPSCGFAEGGMLMLHDFTGNYDVFIVTAAAGSTLSVRQLGGGTGLGYAAGSPVLAVESTAFFLDRAAAVLRRYDGDASDLPLIDDVVQMTIEYFGAARPPVRPRPTSGIANCLYDSAGTYNSVMMPLFGDGADVLVTLAEEVLTDGPWCGSGANQFDADLLRVRRVRIALRLQAADAAVRGIDRSRFLHAGSARHSAGMVPDVTVAVDVAPRNLRQAW